MTDNNIISLVPTGANTTKDITEYELIDIEDNSYYASGFMIFTTQHVGIMADNGETPIPVFLMPLSRLKYAHIVDDDEVF